MSIEKDKFTLYKMARGREREGGKGEKGLDGG